MPRINLSIGPITGFMAVAVVILIALFLGGFSCFQKCSVNAPVIAEWELTFSDEFDGEGQPDPEKWISQEYNRKPNSNGPDGWWSNEQARLDGQGHLKISVNVVNNQNSDHDADHNDYATGMVSTEGRFEQKFGRFEARIKGPKHTGWWGAFWLFSDEVEKVDDSGRDGTEIDIIELFGGLRSPQHALHWDGYGKEHKVKGKKLWLLSDTDEWHTYALEWTPEAYVFFVDGRETWRTKAGGVSQTPVWLKLSGEIATDDQTQQYWSGKINDAKYPDHFLVDWVRVYRQKSMETAAANFPKNPINVEED